MLLNKQLSKIKRSRNFLIVALINKDWKILSTLMNIVIIFNNKIKKQQIIIKSRAKYRVKIKLIKTWILAVQVFKWIFKKLVNLKMLKRMNFNLI